MLTNSEHKVGSLTLIRTTELFKMNDIHSPNGNIMQTNNAPWICLEDGEDDYVIERFELRVRGRKPLILNNPTYSKLMFVTQQYLHLSKTATEQLIRTTILNSPDPLTADEHMRLVRVLEKSLNLKHKENEQL